MGLSKYLIPFLLFPKVYAEAPKLLTKHGVDSIRYISMDGRVAYVVKRPGVLALVGFFRSKDFLTDAQTSEFIVHASQDRVRTLIEIIPSAHSEYNLLKDHKILAAKYGDTATKEVGLGQKARLHLADEWMSYYRPKEKEIVIQNLITEKKYNILLSPKPTTFFSPEVAMINSETVIYTDVNDNGIAGVIAYNLKTTKSTIIFKATQNGTRMEICQGEGFLAIGEFPYDGVTRKSQILTVKTTTAANLSSYETLYSSLDQDLGNMACSARAVYFVKTLSQDKKIGLKKTEVAEAEVKSGKVKIRTDLSYVSHVLNMDGRILAPFRGEFYVLEGEANLATDKLKSSKDENL
jgi:hypothetical protein